MSLNLSVKTIIKGIPIVGPALQKIRSIAFRRSQKPSQNLDVSIRNWSKVSNNLPWFDQPNALELLEARKTIENLSQHDYELLKKWVIDGYVVIDPDDLLVSDIDGMVDDLDALFTTSKPQQGLRLLGVSLTKDGTPLEMPHEELVKLHPSIKANLPINSPWRIHEFHAWSNAAKKIFLNQEVERICSMIFSKKAYPRSSINFMYGSRQRLHQDMAVFHVHPHNYLIGAWLACENINSGSGPLIYYPGSHKEEMWSGFTNYPQTQLRTASHADDLAYHDHVAKIAEKYPRREFLAKKGQVLLWHGMLIHGGSEIKTPGTTRKSFVVHYLVDGVDQTHLIRGPFNWT